TTPTAARYGARMSRSADAARAAALPAEAVVAEAVVAARWDAAPASGWDATPASGWDAAPELLPSEVAAAEATTVAAEATGTDDESAWEPVPVPRPTYTMKP